MAIEGNEFHSWEVFPQAKLLVSYSNPGPIPDDVWNGFVAAIQTNDIASTLNLTNGALTINSVQRKKSADAVVKKKCYIVVVTDDRLTRGIATAVSWLGANLKAFAWDHIDEAITSLKLDKETDRRVREQAMAFRKKGT